MDTLKNLADFWLPMSALGHINLSPVLVGILGVISSITSALPLIDPIKYKMWFWNVKLEAVSFVNLDCGYYMVEIQNCDISVNAGQILF